MNYHAHVYWKNEAERALAVSLRPQFQSLGCGLGSIHDKPIGPHPLPMYQVMFDGTYFVDSLHQFNFSLNASLSVSSHCAYTY